MRVAFDSRPAAGPQGLGHYASCLLQALRDTADEQDEVRESHRPRGADLFHTPWMQGAMLHSPCPMVVTLHDLSALNRPSERLRSGGMHLRLRHLAVQRAVHVIVPTEAVAHEAVAELGLERERVAVIPEASDPAASDPARLDPPTPDPAASDLAASTAPQPGPAPPEWCWEDAARETWRVYRRVLAHPHRPCVTGWSRPGLSKRPAARAQPGSS
jgi:Glycosyltransferase Family 4